MIGFRIIFPGKYIISLVWGTVILLLFPASGEASLVEARERVGFNAGWRFLKTDDLPWTAAQYDYAVMKPWLLAASANILGSFQSKPLLPTVSPGWEAEQAQAGYDDSAWRQLDLPHDWGIEGQFKQEYPGETGKLDWWGTAWYRKRFVSPSTDAGRRVSIEVDGAMSYSTVWLNGRFVGGWPSGYTSYRVDLTPYLLPGSENVIAIRLDNPPGSSRWYPGGGLYRNVWLVKTGPVHIAPAGIIISTPRVSAEKAVVSVNILTDNESDIPSELTFTTGLFPLDSTGKPSATSINPVTSRSQHIGAGSQISTTQTFVVLQPHLWSTSDPQRYVAVTTLRRGDQIIDQCQTLFGIRSAVFDAEHGFILNGAHLPIHGVCMHHDLGALGTAVNVRALERQLQILREMGCNAIRTSHNPPAPELLDLCDRLGFLVMDEIFDAWIKGKTRNDYHQLFPDWHERDLRSVIRRDRNHPSIVLWSIGNEVQEQHDPEGWKIAAHLAGVVREEDRTRPITMALDGVDSGYNGLQHVVDVMGYNYKPAEYARFHANFPTIPVFGSETSSTVSSRGEYFFPYSDNQENAEAHVDFQISSYDRSAGSWATQVDAEWAGQNGGDFVAGEFVWTGFDYLGEPSPYLLDSNMPLKFSDPNVQARANDELSKSGKISVPSRSSYFGIVDLAGFPKDRYFLYQSRWRPELPMAHILPHWSWPERKGEVIPVHVYTTGDEAELFLNGRSLGRKAKDAMSSRVRWDDVRYEEGKLTVVAYRGGHRWAEATTSTAGPAAHIGLKSDRSDLSADGQDLAFISVAIQDELGSLVPRAKNLVRFAITGPGKIVAVDNGDATCHEPFQAVQHSAYNGRVLVVVRTVAGGIGTIELNAESEGLKSSRLQLGAR